MLLSYFYSREESPSPIPIPGYPAEPVCGVVEKRRIAALKFQLNNYAWRRALKRQNERALLTIKNKKGAATERKGRKEQQGSGRKRRNMSAVNNTLREIILRERPLTVTNNGSLSLFLSSSCSSPIPAYSLPAPSPLCCPLCGIPPLPLTPHLHSHPGSANRLHSPCIFPRPSMCTHSRCVNAAGQFQHSNQWTCQRRRIRLLS